MKKLITFQVHFSSSKWKKKSKKNIKLNTVISFYTGHLPLTQTKDKRQMDSEQFPALNTLQGCGPEIDPLEPFFSNQLTSTKFSKSEELIDEMKLKEVQLLGNKLSFISSMLIALREKGVRKDDHEFMMEVMKEMKDYFRYQQLYTDECFKR